MAGSRDQTYKIRSEEKEGALKKKNTQKCGKIIIRKQINISVVENFRSLEIFEGGKK